MKKIVSLKCFHKKYIYCFFVCFFFRCFTISLLFCLLILCCCSLDFLPAVKSPPYAADALNSFCSNCFKATLQNRNTKFCNCNCLGNLLNNENNGFQHIRQQTGSFNTILPMRSKIIKACFTPNRGCDAVISNS